VGFGEGGELRSGAAMRSSSPFVEVSVLYLGSCETSVRRRGLKGSAGGVVASQSFVVFKNTCWWSLSCGGSGAMMYSSSSVDVCGWEPTSTAARRRSFVLYSAPPPFDAFRIAVWTS
jgi:hypothetical protein